MLSKSFSENLGSWFLGTVLINMVGVYQHGPRLKCGNQDIVQKDPRTARGDQYSLPPRWARYPILSRPVRKDQYSLPCAANGDGSIHAMPHMQTVSFQITTIYLISSAVRFKTKTS